MQINIIVIVIIIFIVEVNLLMRGLEDCNNNNNYYLRLSFTIIYITV